MLVKENGRMFKLVVKENGRVFKQKNIYKCSDTCSHLTKQSAHPASADTQSVKMAMLVVRFVFSLVLAVSASKLAKLDCTPTVHSCEGTACICEAMAENYTVSFHPGGTPKPSARYCRRSLQDSGFVTCWVFAPNKTLVNKIVTVATMSKATTVVSDLGNITSYSGNSSSGGGSAAANSYSVSSSGIVVAVLVVLAVTVVTVIV